MKKTRWVTLLVILLLQACGDLPKRQNLVNDVPVEEHTPDTAEQHQSVEEMLAKAKGEEPPPPPAEAPLSELSNVAMSYLGTWRGESSPHAPRTGGVAYTTSGSSNFVKDIMEAVESDNRMNVHCIWMELYADRTGLWVACAIMDDMPVAMDKIDPFTGDRTPLGIRFKWSEEEGNIHIKFPEGMKVTRETNGELSTIRVRDWQLELGTTRHQDDESVYTIRDRYPEHNYRPTATYELTQTNYYMVGRDSKVERPIMQ